MMCDQIIAKLARELIQAMKARAKSRSPEDLKTVLRLQTALAQAIAGEEQEAHRQNMVQSLKDELHAEFEQR
jgi:hypothetical protein